MYIKRGNMVAIVSSNNILNQALSNNNFLNREEIIPRPARVQGIWDTLVSTIAPRNAVTGNRQFTFLPYSLESLLGEFSYRSLVAREGGLSLHREKKLLVEKVKNQLLPHIRREFDWDNRAAPV